MAIVSLTKKVDFDVKYMKVEIEPRYWEDAILNGVPDTEGKMHFRTGDSLEFTIDVNTGRIQNWQQGTTADMFYKVCDAGVYTIQDHYKNDIMKREYSYVPNSLCIGSVLIGDYVSLKIDENGYIQDWKFLGEEDWENYAEDYM